MSIVFISLFTACKNGKKEPVPADSTSDAIADDSVAGSISIAQEDSAKILDNLQASDFSLSDWKHLKLVDYGIDAPDSNAVKPFYPEKGFMETYRSVLKWNADKSLVLDLGSEGLIPVTDDSGKNIGLEGGDPDTEVRILDMNNHTQKRLLFFGPSSHIISGQWIGKDEIAVMGSFPLSNPNKSDTLLYVWNVSTNFGRTYKWHTTR